MDPRIVVLPNVVRDAVAPNTLSGMTGSPATAPDVRSLKGDGRQLVRIALLAGMGLALILVVIGGRAW